MVSCLDEKQAQGGEKGEGNFTMKHTPHCKASVVKFSKCSIF